MGWLTRHVEKIAMDAATDYLKSQAVTDQIERVLTTFLRECPDDGLTRIGFILKIAIELVDRSTTPLPWFKAKEMASQVYQQFRADNKGVQFGDAGWDWSGRGARELAHEYEIQHWEPTP